MLDREQMNESPKYDSIKEFQEVLSQKNMNPDRSHIV
ncbi:MAG: hypothetical protein ACI8ZM_005245 [Crocinitomix sp.]|jgi:hypothetical protein